MGYRGDDGIVGHIGNRGRHFRPLSADSILYFGITPFNHPLWEYRDGIREHRMLVIVSYLSYTSYASYITYLYVFPMSPMQR